MKHLVLLLIALVGVLCQAQNSLWDKVKESSISSQQERIIVPEVYTTWQVQEAAFVHLLSQAPLEKSGSAMEIVLPLPNGKQERFALMNSPIMEEELSGRYSNIHTFSGKGLDNTTATLRCDWTPKGFHAIITHPTGTVYIDPYSVGNVENYIVYYSRDFKGKQEKVEALSACQAIVEDVPKWVKNQNEEQTSYKSIDGFLRTYRLAVATTGEYTDYHGGTKADALAAIVTTINRVNSIYEKELGIRLILVGNNDDVIYTNATTDPYSNYNTMGMVTENQTTIDAVIGDANYDIGHVFGTGLGGLSVVYATCRPNIKAKGVTGLPDPVGDPFDIEYVCHEMGHQFGANHTFNSNSSNVCGAQRSAGSAYEPGSGTTIMAYQGLCAPHNIGTGTDGYFHSTSIQSILGYATASLGDGCATKISIGNGEPIVEAGDKYVIPKSTPFTLVGSGSDPDGDAITYCWEQYDLGFSGPPDDPTVASAPLFRSFLPTTDSTRTFPQISDIVNNTQTPGEILSEVGRNMKFRLTVRDNGVTGLGGRFGIDETDITVSGNSGPFLVTSPTTAVNWEANSTQTILWDVANTDMPPVSCENVDILLSLDGGYTYPIVLAHNVPNDGSHAAVIPYQLTTDARVKISCNDNVFFDISNENFSIVPPTTSGFYIKPVPYQQGVCPPNNVQYLVEIGQTLGYNNTLTLTASGEPNGTTVSFSPSTVIPPATTIMTIAGTANVSAGKYTLNITGSDGTLTNAAAIELQVKESALTTPTLYLPGNGSIDESLIPSMSWGMVAGAADYTLEIATDPSFANIVETAVGLTTFSYVPSLLGGNTTYYWRVQAFNECGASANSATYNFTTTTPLNYCTIQGTTPDEWIQQIVIGDINHTSGDNEGYADFTNLVTDLNQEGLYYIKLYPGFSATPYSEHWRIGIDFNQNGDFTDPGELVFETPAASNTVVNGVFTIPTGSPLGVTRMRVIMQYNTTPAACGAYQYGEAEDYTVNIGYCHLQATNSSNEWIETVDLNSINCTSGNDNGYADFTHISTNLIQGQSYPLSLTPGFWGLSQDEYWQVWMDFDQDGQFDASEMVLNKDIPTSSAINEMINVPLNASIGPVRMRISMRNDTTVNVCGDFVQGEVEEYMVFIDGASACNDSDGDGFCDINDNCPNMANSLQTDADNDGIGDPCDACPNDANNDADNDGVCDDVDICLGFDDAIDTDNDGTPDACDICPNSPTGDSDGDGVCDDVDVCAGFDDTIDTDNDGIPDGCETSIELDFKVFLEGSYMSGTANMHTYLRDANLIPLTQSYNFAPYNYTGTESITSTIPNMVDWILVEARVGTPNLNQSQGKGTVIVERKAAILLEDGSVVSADGQSLVSFDNLIDGESYYFVIRHRNHLDIMTATDLPKASLMTYDFTTDSALTYGFNQVKSMVDGKFAMHAGDFNHDGIIQTTDYDMWKFNPAILNTYYTTDANLDGLVQLTDYDSWYLNKAKNGHVEISLP